MQQNNCPDEEFDKLFEECERLDQQSPLLPIRAGPPQLLLDRVTPEHRRVIEQLESMLPRKIAETEDFESLYNYFVFAFKLRKKDLYEIPLKKLKAALREKSENGTLEEKKRVRLTAYILAMIYSQNDLWELV
jgi:hypothetical protein